MVLPLEHAILLRAVARTGNPAFGVGVGVAGRVNYAAALFRDRRSRQGILQLDDGRGTHVFTGPERYSFPANR